MAPLTPLPVRRMAVYELMNLTRLESALVITGDDEPAVLRRLHRVLPPELRRWKPESDDISVQLLSPRLNEGMTEEFVRTYLENMSRRTWRFHVWRAEPR
ncbi:MAG: hypothetical protein KGL74_06600 [Elusimicrobia bacterium]|nr:hypothetical protein [Elusimicrobiota bacterium]MDE2510773.1 hypothetical protein [Elusimicrobiota bacterium]